MTSAERESLRIELARTMRDDPRSYPVGKLLDAAKADSGGYHTPIDGICHCGRLLAAGDGETCFECEVHS